ncbi:MAG: SCO family protein [Gammaproteobacteria bacterium]|nr:SCO family protein [Gammaproteobacteria bacterium]
MRNLLKFGILFCAAIASSATFGLGGDFTLTADDGSDYSLSDSRGKVVILSFGFTFCPDICPTALATISLALRGLGDDASHVDAFFISLDPDRDTPDHLREYTRYFHRDLRGLTGTAEDLKTVADRYRVRYSFVGKGTDKHYTMDHSANLYVIDAQGKLFGILPHGLPPDAVTNSLKSALASRRAGGKTVH